MASTTWSSPVTHYNSGGTSKGSWYVNHSVFGQVTVPYAFPFTLETSRIPVEADDYFTANLAYQHNYPTRNENSMTYRLLADNPGIDKRFEVIFYEVVPNLQTGEHEHGIVTAGADVDLDWSNVIDRNGTIPSGESVIETGFAVKLSLSSLVLSSGSGITLANDELTFTDSGLCAIDAFLALMTRGVSISTGAAANVSSGAGRMHVDIYWKLTRSGGTEQILSSTRATYYIRQASNGTGKHVGPLVHNVNSEFVANIGSGDKVSIWAEGRLGQVDGTNVVAQLKTSDSGDRGHVASKISILCMDTTADGVSGSFTELQQTPNTLSGFAGKHLRVNPAESALEFADAPPETFTGLDDTPATISAGYYVRGNTAGTALEMVQAPDSVTGGVRNFVQLDDTPSTLSGNGGRFLQINPAGNAIEYTNPTLGETNVQADWGVTSSASDAFIKNKPSLITAFTGLSDTPASLTGQGNKAVMVNPGGTALVLADNAGPKGGLVATSSALHSGTIPSGGHNWGSEMVGLRWTFNSSRPNSGLYFIEVGGGSTSNPQGNAIEVFHGVLPPTSLLGWIMEIEHNNAVVGRTFLQYGPGDADTESNVMSSVSNLAFRAGGADYQVWIKQTEKTGTPNAIQIRPHYGVSSQNSGSSLPSNLVLKLYEWLGGRGADGLLSASALTGQGNKIVMVNSAANDLTFASRLERQVLASYSRTAFSGAGSTTGINSQFAANQFKRMEVNISSSLQSVSDSKRYLRVEIVISPNVNALAGKKLWGYSTPVLVSDFLLGTSNAAGIDAGDIDGWSFPGLFESDSSNVANWNRVVWGRGSTSSTQGNIGFMFTRTIFLHEYRLVLLPAPV